MILDMFLKLSTAGPVLGTPPGISPLSVLGKVKKGRHSGSLAGLTGPRHFAYQSARSPARQTPGGRAAGRAQDAESEGARPNAQVINRPGHEPWRPEAVARRS